MPRRSFVIGSIAVALVLSLGVGASGARPTSGADTVTIGMLTGLGSKAGLEVLIPNFERVYPNIEVKPTYFPLTTDLITIEATELAAGNAPAILAVFPGCATPLSVCVLAKAGHLAPMTNKPWVKRSLPAVTSLSKYGQSLFGFEPAVTPFGVFTNDDKFKQLGLTIPRTFPQLLAVCRKAKAAGTAAVLLAGGSATRVAFLIAGLAVTTVYGKDKHWVTKKRAGKVTFSGSPGWHQALNEFIEMNSAGCFQPGAAGTTTIFAQFARGQALMLPFFTTDKGTIDATNPPFRYSHHTFPGGATESQTRTLLNLQPEVGVNAHSSKQEQAAAQAFVDFIARPKQNALFAQLGGGLTQDQFLKGQIPAFMSDFATVLEQHTYVASPYSSWWNPSVLLALQQDGIGLLTGQRSADDVLNAMDAAWKQGPA